jgi:transcriptional regulator of NAD metabolism
MEKKQQSYYMVIPPQVWDSEISAKAMILYGHISVLANKHGYCYAFNQYFETVMKSSASTIQRCFLELEESGLITRKLIYKPGTKEVEKRKIFLNIGIVKDDNRPIVKNDYTPIVKDDTDNSTSSNTTSLPNTIKNNKLGSSLADASEDPNLENFKNVKDVWSKRIGNEEQVFSIFNNLSIKKQTEFISHSTSAINHQIIPNSTSLSDYLEDWIEDN